MDKIAPIAFSLLPLKTRAQIPAPRALEQAHFSRHSASTCGTFCIFSCQPIAIIIVSGSSHGFNAK